jgi:hypothetical protein
MRVAARPSLEEVGTTPAEELVVPRQAADVVRARCADEPVASSSPRDGARARDRCAEEETDQHERDDAHRVNRTRASARGLHAADYDPVS